MALNDIDLVALLEVRQHVHEIDITGVSQVDRHAKAGGLIVDKVMSHHEQAGLRDLADRRLVILEFYERRGEAFESIGDTDGVGSEDAQVVRPRQRQHLFLQSAAFFIRVREPLRDDDGTLDAFGDAAFENIVDLLSGDAGHGEIDVSRQFVKAGANVEVVGVRLRHVGIDHIDLTLVAITVQRRQNTDRRPNGRTRQPDDDDFFGP